MKVWTFIRPDGSFVADSGFESEADAWRVGLGWPDAEEIEWSKAQGYRVVRAELAIPGVPFPPDEARGGVAR